ncbi:MAG: hypothetical protein OXG35_01315, partial [Acidobacteria bacterium]|nr:hypothetical protein [Acidobacteriota bacterium]
KSDRDAGEWTPARHGAWFAERVIAVKLEYELSVDPRERDALEALLAAGGGAAELRGRGHHVADGGHQQRLSAPRPPAPSPSRSPSRSR